MDQFKVTRDGKKDLVFTGETIASASNLTPNNDSRYSELTLYRTSSGQFVFEDRYITRWQGEQCSFSAEVFQDAEALKDHLEEQIEDGIGGMMKELIEKAAEEVPGLAELITETIA